MSSPEIYDNTYEWQGDVLDLLYMDDWRDSKVCDIYTPSPIAESSCIVLNTLSSNISTNGTLIDPAMLTFEAHIGSGTFSNVYRVKHAQLGSCIVKMSKTTDVIAEDTIREIAILKILNHPCIINPIAYSSDALLLPVAKGTLRECWDHSDNAKNGYVRDLCYAVSYIHECSIIHRDIKPENILLVGDRMQLADFGSALFSPSSQALINKHDIVTHGYRAPELLLDKYRPYTEAIDVWALGVVLWELFTKQRLINVQEDDDSPRNRDNATMKDMLKCMPNVREAWPQVVTCSEWSLYASWSLEIDVLRRDGLARYLATTLADAVAHYSAGATITACLEWNPLRRPRRTSLISWIDAAHKIPNYKHITSSIIAISPYDVFRFSTIVKLIAAGRSFGHSVATLILAIVYYDRYVYIASTDSTPWSIENSRVAAAVALSIAVDMYEIASAPSHTYLTELGVTSPYQYDFTAKRQQFLDVLDYQLVETTAHPIATRSDSIINDHSTTDGLSSNAFSILAIEKALLSAYTQGLHVTMNPHALARRIQSELTTTKHKRRGSDLPFTL